MDIEQIKKKVKNQKVIALGGDERALVDDALRLIRDDVLSKDDGNLNHLRFRASEDQLEDLMNTLNTMPFLAKRRLVEIHCAEKIQAEDDILGYLDDPSPSSVLVLVFDKIDRRNKLVSALMSKDLLFLFEIKDESDRIKLIMNEALSAGLVIEESSAQLLNAVTDGDLLSIRSSINKLALFFEGRVTADEIEKHVIDSSEQDVFLLARLIAEGDLKKALIALHRLKKSQENPIKFLGVLAWQFRALLHIRHLKDQGLNDWDTRKQVGVFGDRYDWMVRIAKKKEITFHIGRLAKLIECDQQLKSINTKEPFSLIEKVVYQSAMGF